MNTIEINRSQLKYGKDIYNVLQDKLNLPEWFGKNADALWDMITGHIELPVKFIFIGFDNKEKHYSDEYYIKMVFDTIELATKEMPDRVYIEFKNLN